MYHVISRHRAHKTRQVGEACDNRSHDLYALQQIERRGQYRIDREKIRSRPLFTLKVSKQSLCLNCLTADIAQRWRNDEHANRMRFVLSHHLMSEGCRFRDIGSTAACNSSGTSFTTKRAVRKNGQPYLSQLDQKRSRALSGLIRSAYRRMI